MDNAGTADQGASQSVESRIASKFGLPTGGEPEAEAEGAAEAESEFAEIDWEGAKYQIPAKLKEGFLKNEDYTLSLIHI